MEKLIYVCKKRFWDGIILILIVFMCFYGGYLAGRVEQVRKNKAMLEVVPDVNSVSAEDSLHRAV